MLIANSTSYGPNVAFATKAQSGTKVPEWLAPAEAHQSLWLTPGFGLFKANKAHTQKYNKRVEPFLPPC